jgi:hypothetical protein
MLCILSIPRRADYHGRLHPIREVRNERQELWNRCLLISFFNMGQSFLGNISWMYPCRQFLLIWRAPPNYQQTGLSAQRLGECSPMVTPVLLTRVAAPFRLPASYFFRLSPFGTDSFLKWPGFPQHQLTVSSLGGGGGGQHPHLTAACGVQGLVSRITACPRYAPHLVLMPRRQFSVPLGPRLF